MKKVLIAVVFALSAVLGSAKEKTIKIYTWNEEFLSIYDLVCREEMEARGVKAEFIINSSMDGLYQRELDKNLSKNNVDIFLTEPEYLRKYIETNQVADIADLGISGNDIAGQYEYTKRHAMDGDGRIKALTWQCCPGGFVYRRSIAKKVFGTDDPDEIQHLLEDWSRFDNAAARCAKNGYKIAASCESTYHVFGSNLVEPLVSSGKKGSIVNIDQSMMDWVEQAKYFLENGYVHDFYQWSAEWFEAMKDKSTFGFFGPGWFVDFILTPSFSVISGDWAFCRGPAGWYWGGSYVSVAAGSKNKDEAAYILKKISCDEKAMELIHKTNGEFVNNRNVMNKVALSRDAGKDFLGGQNPFKFFCYSAETVGGVVADDYTISSSFVACMKDYISGVCSKEEAILNFKKEVSSSGSRR